MQKEEVLQVPKQISLQAVEKTMVKEAVPRQPMEDEEPVVVKRHHSSQRAHAATGSWQNLWLHRGTHAGAAHS